MRLAVNAADVALILIVLFLVAQFDLTSLRFSLLGHPSAFHTLNNPSLL